MVWVVWVEWVALEIWMSSLSWHAVVQVEAV